MTPIKSKKVLLLYTDKYYFVKQVYPFGLNIIADTLKRSGYQVEIETPFLPEEDMALNLRAVLDRIEPDVIGLGIRNLDTTMACEHYGNYEGDGFRTFYFLPDVKRMVDIIKQYRPGIPLVAGGGAFSISSVSILEYLGLDYGFEGEGEQAFREFLDVYPDREKMTMIPGLVFRKGSSSFQRNPRRSFSFGANSFTIDREPKFAYAFETAGMPVQVKRGCNQNCSYCVEPQIEGKRFSFRQPDQVISELEMIAERHAGVRSLFFVDTEFNVPDLSYGVELIGRILNAGLHESFRFASQFLPAPFDADFAGRLKAAGFSVILTADSFADSVLEKNGKSCRRNDILQALELCEQFGIDCTVNLIFGLPGENYETVNSTIDAMAAYPETHLRRYEYTVGTRIYNGTPLHRFVGTHSVDDCLYGRQTPGCLEPLFYCSPASPQDLKHYIDERVPSPMVFFNRMDAQVFEKLAVGFLADQQLWDRALERFAEIDVAAQTSIYEYLFRKLTENNRLDSARSISEQLLNGIFQSGQDAQYAQQIQVVQHYLRLLTLYT